MAYPKLNARSIRLFAATPEELEKRRPNLNAPHFRILRSEVDKLLSISGDGDPMVSLSIWKRKGQDGKPDYFTAELGYPDTAEMQESLRTKDDQWLAAHPRTAQDTARRHEYARAKAMNDAAQKRVFENPEDVDVNDLPF